MMAQPNRRPQAMDKIVLGVIRHDMSNVWQLTDFVRAASRVATRDHDTDTWIVAHDPTNRLTDTLISGRCHGAAIDHDEFGVVWRCLNGAARVKISRDGHRVGLIDATAEGDDGVLHTSVMGSGVI
jgi:hypothetical protein